MAEMIRGAIERRRKAKVRTVSEMPRVMKKNKKKMMVMMMMIVDAVIIWLLIKQALRLSNLSVVQNL